MIPSWHRCWKVIYKSVPSNRIGDFEVIKDGKNITLLSHSIAPVNWMGNCDDEWRLYRRLRKHAKGNVLIGGLGLGFDLLHIASKQRVKSITIIEKSQDVIDLVWPYIPHPKSTLIHRNVYKYLKDTQQKFNTMYFDIFPGGCEDFPKRTRALRRLAQTFIRPRGKIIFFREYISSLDDYSSQLNLFISGSDYK